MSESIKPHVWAKYWLFNIYVFAVCVITSAMNYTVTPQTCDDLACENSNACHTSLLNGTPTAQSYCACKGEWAGLRCQLRLNIISRSVTTDRATLEVHGLSSVGNNIMFNVVDFHMSEMTIALWNLNISDQCLMLRRRHLSERLIILKGLIRGQEYRVCIANGFLDSCSALRHHSENTSTSSNCLHFETKLTDTPSLDVGLIVVPFSLFIFILVLTVIIYCQRHSLLVQLCFNKICCRCCYCFRKRIQRRRRLMYTQADVSSEVLMSSDIPIDFESTSDTHTGAGRDSSNIRTRSSNASSLTSHRSACSLDPDGTALIPTSLEYNTFLYENQSLIPPLYSPQDHKIMTLTFLDEDVIPSSAEPSKDIFPHQPKGYLLNPITDTQVHMKDIIDCNYLMQRLIIPTSFVHDIPVNSLSESINLQWKSDNCQNAGPLKKRYLHHQYLHKPYDKNHLFQHKIRSKRSTCRFSNREPIVTFRETNRHYLQQRPCSLPLIAIQHEPRNNRSMDSCVWDSCSLKYSHNADIKSYNNENISTPALPWLNNCITGDNKLLPGGKTASIKTNNVSGTLINYCHNLETDSHTHFQNSNCNLAHDVYISNTLPRSRKPKLPHHLNNVQDSWFSDKHNSDSHVKTYIPPNKPTLLDLPIRAKDFRLESHSQPTTPVSAESSTLSESKSGNKRVKGFVSHLEHNLPFLKSSKTKRPSYEEKEFRDMQSPLAEEREKVSKKSHTSSFSKKGSKGKQKPYNTNHRHSFTFGANIFEGHPSEHSLPPFSTDDEDVEGANETHSWDDLSDDTSSISIIFESRATTFSSLNEDGTNLVTPFITEDSSDDDTYKDINSLSGSLETLQDENIETEQSIL